MAVIMKCAVCRRRLWDALPCSGCGAFRRRFWVDYYPDGRNGKRVQMPLDEKIQSAETAAAIDRGIRGAARNVDDDIPPAYGDTVADLFPKYLEWYGLYRAASSKHDVESVYNNHIKTMLGDMTVFAINRQHFTVYQQARKATTVTNRTINKELDYFRGFLRWCRVERRMSIARIETDRLPYNRPLPIVLSPEEVLDIINAAEPFYQAFFIFLYSLGLRKAEAQHIRWQDIDFANKQVRVIQKGGSYKLLPLNDWAQAALIILQKWREETKKTPAVVVNTGPGDYVFASMRSGGKPIQNVRRAIERACEKAKVTKYVNSHLFRHSIATHFMAGDVNLRMIQKFLGHADRKATEFYTHVSLEHLRGITDRFFPAISAKQPAKSLRKQTTGFPHVVK